MACQERPCNATLSNIGYACTPDQEVAYKLGFIRTYDSTGAKNRISKSASLDQTFFDDMVNDTDLSKRLYILPPMNNIKDVSAEAKKFTFDNQSTEHISDGVRTFEAMVAGGNSGANAPKMKAKIEGFRNGDFSVYIITTNNQLVGNISSDGLFIEPIAVDTQSISVTLVKKTEDAPQHLMLMFNFSKKNKDSDLVTIECTELGGADLLALRSPLDVSYVLIESLTTNLKFKLVTDGGTPITPITVDGMVAADFVSSVTASTSKVRNATDSTDVTVTSVESPDGTYTLTFSVAQTLGDAIIVDGVYNGYDFTNVKAEPFTLV